MDHVARPLHILLAEKEEMIWFNNIICLKPCQFERITWRCLFVLKYVMESAVQSAMLSVMKFVMLEKDI